MAGHVGRESRSVEQELYRDASRFTFLQAVRLLEELESRRRPRRKGPGETGHHEDELVLFRHKVRLDSPPTDVEALAHDEPSQRPVMTTNVIGLAGVLGPLPLNVTEQLFAEARHGRRAFADFLDIFNHRLISLLYRARRKYRPALDSNTPADGRVARVLASILGLGTRSLRGRVLGDGSKDHALLTYAGLFAERYRSPAGLERILSDYFGVPAALETFKGHWDALEPEDRTAIGSVRGRNHTLGATALVGKRVWNPAARFEVRLGPLDLTRFRAFLPPANDAWPRLVALVRFYARDELDFDARLVLRREQIPSLHLRARGGDAYLGWTTWLHRRTPERDDAQVQLAGPR